MSLTFAYAQSGEIELGFHELEAHERRPNTLLRSKFPRVEGTADLAEGWVRPLSVGPAVSFDGVGYGS
jgi:hypothetical protein